MYDFMRDESLTERERDLLGKLTNQPLRTYDNLTIRAPEIDGIIRRSTNEFDLEITGINAHIYITEQTINWTEGSRSGSFKVPANEEHKYHFVAWLPLLAIKELTPWNCKRIADMSDYPDMVRGGDWSGIRDSRVEVIWSIFFTELFK